MSKGILLVILVSKSSCPSAVMTEKYYGLLFLMIWYRHLGISSSRLFHSDFLVWLSPLPERRHDDDKWDGINFLSICYCFPLGLHPRSKSLWVQEDRRNTTRKKEIKTSEDTDKALVFLSSLLGSKISLVEEFSFLLLSLTVTTRIQERQSGTSHKRTWKLERR